MGFFICDSCGREVGLFDGILSWHQEGQELGNFTITHRPGQYCLGQPGNNVSRELFRVASVKGYLAFVQYLLTRWGEGYVLKDYSSLQRIIIQISSHIHEGMANLLGE
ncbi:MULTISPECIES: hypothetical protein [Desulfofundulus]|jgi:hypothetical protein|uniref:Uncharacterized protein n=1 Tax=Desulfofundulus australicus DSM 11792 TaxID=1121425 RepID=A0A1M4UL76_9FIRM|nr:MULTISPECIES: hypothetical protein [Desulfofundulus]MBE3586281.1 hypothetical protein [Thermoanaerobacter sp.]MCS5695779.1 hypothetical protein [Desulfofundulus thermocisternus]MDK2887207.1 hypothetical protein [Thermoanaerobacter sp.]SHE57340.1 hypothetical protein SAMN02745218_00496 [Desulfofundulus australicus DSM 11792]